MNEKKCREEQGISGRGGHSWCGQDTGGMNEYIGDFGICQLSILAGVVLAYGALLCQLLASYYDYVTNHSKT